MNKGELPALISLLDDPDQEVYNHIHQKILSFGIEAIPDLEDAWEHSFDLELQQKIEQIIHTIQFEKVKQRLAEWCKNDAENLLEGLLSIALYQYPDLDEEKIKKLIDRIKKDIWLEMRKEMTALEKVKTINYFLYDIYGFSGNTSNFHSAKNSFINDVVESKKGNPLLLCCLYSIIAQSLSIPIYGVNLPEHFVLAYMDNFAVFGSSENENGSDVLFYINAFSKGTVFGKKKLITFYDSLNFSPNIVFTNLATILTL